MCVAEKGVFRFTLTTTGTAGHASMPRIADNALLKLAPLLEAMRPGRAGFDVTEGPRLLLEGLGVQLDAGMRAVESRWTRCARATPGWPCSSSRCSA